MTFPLFPNGDQPNRRFGYRGTGTLNLHLPDPVEVVVIVQAPNVGRDERVYMASNVNGWSPRNDRFTLRRRSDGRYEIRQLLAPGTSFEFKITRGGWDRVEVSADGSDLNNHVHKVHENATIEIAVPDWQDHHPRAPKPRTTVGDVRSLGEFNIPALNRMREVLVYLPPGYDHEPDRHYPVMYMFDGQNLFDESTAFAGEWHVDETCERMIRNQELPPMIVVAIYNGGDTRVSEQSPWSHWYYEGAAEGEAFVTWVAQDLKRRIDRGFRTLPAAVTTGIGGSSMGGLTSLYAAFRFPEVFGRILAMSSSIWFGERQLFNYVRSRPRPDGTRFYLDCGHHEGGKREAIAFLRQTQEMATVLRQMGFQDGRDLKFVEDPHGHHSEGDWSRRLPEALRYLWGT